MNIYLYIMYAYVYICVLCVNSHSAHSIYIYIYIYACFLLVVVNVMTIQPNSPIPGCTEIVRFLPTISFSMHIKTHIET